MSEASSETKEQGANALKTPLQNWIKAQHPERDDLKISDFSAPAAGASNETLLFDLSWQEAGQVQEQKLVARLKPEGEGVFPEYDLPLQYRAMSRLQNTDVRVPVLCGFEDDVSVLGKPFYLMEQIKGQYMADNPPYQMEGWLTEISPESRGKIWESGIRSVAAVNRVDWQALGFADLWDMENHATPLAQLLDYYDRFFDWAQSLGRPFPKLAVVQRYLRENQPENDPVALCWGDAKPPNLMVRDDEVVGVLDWEMVHLGNPVHDLTWWFVLDDSLTDGLSLPKLPGLPDRARMIALWEEQSQCSAAQLDYYELLSTYQFAIIMHRVGTRLTAQGIFSKEDEFDIKNNCTPLLDAQIAKFGL